MCTGAIRCTQPADPPLAVAYAQGYYTADLTTDAAMLPAL